MATPDPDRVLSCAEGLQGEVEALAERAQKQGWSQREVAEALLDMVAARIAEKVSPAAAEAAVRTLQRKVAGWQE